ncbi:MAG: ATPase, T2SS/T4P/T4SS family, partial [Kiritimatiellia bacterium]
MSAEFSFIIKQPGTSPTPLDLPLGSFLIGRGKGCGIRLRHPEVSERHARLVLTRDRGTIEDLGSANGTWTGGRHIEAPTPLAAGQEIGIGPYLLIVQRVPEAAAHVPPPVPPVQTSEPPSPPSPPAAPPAPQPAEQPAGKSPFRAPPTDPKVAIRREIKNQIHRELVQRLDLKRLTAARVNAAELQQRARETLDAVIAEARDKLPPGIDPGQLAIEIFNEAMRLGPLEELLADESVTEIMINGPHQVYVERHGKLELTDQNFMDDASVLAIIERIVSPIGRRIDESQPYVDARLPDGSRVNAIIPPLSLIGPCVTIRKFSRVPLTEADLIRFGTWTAEMANFLSICVQMRKNIIVSGGTGSGKTTLL